MIVAPAIEFLRGFSGTPWSLLSIAPEGAVSARTFSTDAQDVDAENWIAARNESGNIYFQINPLVRPVSAKAKKTDVAKAAYLWADVDPPVGDEDVWRAEVILRGTRGLPATVPLPAWHIDSGRGFWFLWELDPPVALTDVEQIEAVEARGRGVALALAAVELYRSVDLHCHNVDRVARLPGTINHKTGRRAAVLEHSRHSYPLEAFPLSPLSRRASEPLGERPGDMMLGRRLFGIIGYVASATPNRDRNIRTFGAGCVIGRMVAAGWIVPGDVKDDIVGAAVFAGLSIQEATTAFQSGLRAGGGHA